MGEKDLLSEDSYGACALCPRRCGARRAQGRPGRCGMTSELRVARSALHFWEEPPISGEAGSGTIFFSGCPLGCVYCQNHEISGGGFGLPVTTARLAEMMLELQGAGALNINMVTALHFAPQVREAVGYFDCSDAKRDYAPIVGSRRNDFRGSCVYCNHCRPCPKEIDIAAVNKYLDIAKLDESAIPSSILQHYRSLEHPASECIGCGSCEKRCPFGVSVIENMKHATRLFGR